MPNLALIETYTNDKHLGEDLKWLKFYNQYCEKELWTLKDRRYTVLRRKTENTSLNDNSVYGLNLRSEETLV